MPDVAPLLACVRGSNVASDNDTTGEGGKEEEGESADSDTAWHRTTGQQARARSRGRRRSGRRGGASERRQWSVGLGGMAEAWGLHWLIGWRARGGEKAPLQRGH